jgi:hypothetical protein
MTLTSASDLQTKNYFLTEARSMNTYCHMVQVALSSDMHGWWWWLGLRYCSIVNHFSPAVGCGTDSLAFLGKGSDYGAVRVATWVEFTVHLEALHACALYCKVKVCGG